MQFKYIAVSSRKYKMVFPRREKLIIYLQNAIISLKLITWFEKSAGEHDAAAFTSPSSTRGRKATPQKDLNHSGHTLGKKHRLNTWCMQIESGVLDNLAGRESGFILSVI